MAVNYGELVEEVRSYLYNRKDLTAIIPQFITFGENTIFRRLRCRANEKSFTTTLTENFGFTLPDDFIEMKYLLVEGRPMTRISDIEYHDLLNSDNAAGLPSRFARVVNDIKIWRQADSEYDVEMIYWNDQAGDMVNDEDSTPVLLFAPDLYLYAALIEAMPFLAKDERIGTWQNMFEQGLAQVEYQTQESEYAGSNVNVSSAYSDPIRGVQSGRRL